MLPFPLWFLPMLAPGANFPTVPCIQVFHQVDELLPNVGVPLDDVLAVALLLFFGISTLKGAADADAKAAEEKEEADEAVSELAAAGKG